MNAMTINLDSFCIKGSIYEEEIPMGDLNFSKICEKRVELNLMGNLGNKRIKSENTIVHGYLPRDKVIGLMYNVDLLLRLLLTKN